MVVPISFTNIALRDAGLFVAAGLLWYFFADLSAATGWRADFAGVVVGAGLALCAHLLHEWGHVIGGLLGRSTMKPAASLSSLSLFTYSSTKNSKAQFMLMSAMGFLATGLTVAFCFTVLPPDLLASRIARGYALVQVALALVLEMPLVIWALVGKSLPPLDKPLLDRAR